MISKKDVCKNKDCSRYTHIYGKGLCFYCWKNQKKIHRIPVRSETEQKRLEKYYPIRDQYLIDHSICEVEGCNHKSEEVHHKEGRIGQNLFKSLLAVCKQHHKKIELEPNWAKENNYSLTRI